MTSNTGRAGSPHWLDRILPSGPKASITQLREDLARMSRLAGDLGERCSALERKRDEHADEIGRLQRTVSTLTSQLEAEARGRETTAATLAGLDEKVRAGALDTERLRVNLTALAKRLEAEAENSQKVATTLYRRIAQLRSPDDPNTAEAPIAPA